MSDDHPTKWDEDGPPPTEEELREAEAFGASVERLLDGDPGGDLEGEPGAGPVDELTATARMIRSSLHEEHLAELKRDELIQQAMKRALARPAQLLSSRARRLAPVLALAASLMLVLGAGLMLWRGRPAGQRHVAGPPRQMVSRASDELMGRPFKDRAGAAKRLDLVYADRLSGYRQVMLARGTP